MIRLARAASTTMAALVALAAVQAGAAHAQDSAQPLVPVPAAGGAAAAAHAGVYNGRLRELDVRLPKLAAEVSIDGRLDEGVWSQAALLTGFSQYAPVDGRAAEDSTEVLIWYTDRAMYFGVRAFEPHGAVIATLAERDRIHGDDHIQIILDTFNDRRRALLFAVNPLGVQTDGTFADGTGSDLNPDFIFDSKGRLTDYGYELEIRIPFKSLRYQSADVQSWGINILRRVQHSGHEQSWTPAERGRPSFLAQSGTLVGLESLQRGLVLDVNPVMTARSVGQRRPDASWSYRGEDPEFGGNVRWGVTSNLTASGTYNPDFSQVEADAGQVVYDPRNALFFPEKRPFFLEGNENFATPNQLIYTRRIIAPLTAAKLSGKVGGLNIGVLSALDDDALSASGTDRPFFNVVRLRRDLGAQSNAGLVYTDRMEGGDYNRVAGVDTRLLVGGRYIFSGQVAASFTSRAGEAAHWRPLFDVALNRPGRDWGFNAVLAGVHPEFNAGAGFVPRTGVVRANLTPRRTFFPGGDLLETYSVSLILDGTWDYDRFRSGTVPNDIKVNTSSVFSLRGGWRAQLYTWVESFLYPSGMYASYYIERHNDAGAVDTVAYSGTHRLPNLGGFVQLNTPQFQSFSGSAQIVGGRDVNFDEWSSAWILFTTLSADWRPSDRMRIGARYVEQRFHRYSDGSLVRLRMIPRVKLEYQVARPVFFRFVGQYDATKVDDLRDDSRTRDPILLRRADGTFRRAAAVERGSFRADWLFSYQPNPGTVVFAGYGTSLNATEFLEPRALERTADGFFVKMSYLFRM
jgi:hypothetical protein